MWLLLLFIHAFALAGFNLILRKSLLDKVDRFTLATIMQTGITVPMLFLLVFQTPSFEGYRSIDFIILIFATLLPIALHVANVKALQYLETGVYSVIYNLRLLIATVLGILFLSEQIVWLRILGGILILISIFIVHQKGGSSIKAMGIKWAVFAAFVISFLNITEKAMIENVGVVDYLPVSVTSGTLIMWVTLLYRNRGSIDPRLFYKPEMLQLMAFRAISAYAFILALASGALVSVGNYISGLSVILMVGIGAVFLKEKDYLFRKFLATGVAVIGLTIILISGLI
ncbi:MAG: EamA family transporter [Candidatus Saccharimonadales bacterium]